jgi:uncharacterized protein YchJ
MLSIQDNISLTDEEKLNRLKKAKDGSWYENWNPYCMTCDTMSRMTKKDHGFKCLHCGNLIGWDLTRLQESPLNDEIKETIRLKNLKTKYEESQKEIAFKETVRKIANNSCLSSSETPFKHYGVKIGRNSPCPCGNGKKYKTCHLNS